MNRTQALKVLHLDENSNSHAVEASYWTLVRHAQVRSPDEATAAREIEELNRAYGALTPTPAPMEMAAKETPPGRRAPATGPYGAAPSAQADNIVDAALAWLGAESARVRERWSGRNAEIALICGAVAALAVLALMAGTGLLVVLFCVVVVFVGVWAPWRNDPPNEGRG